MGKLITGFWPAEMIINIPTPAWREKSVILPPWHLYLRQNCNNMLNEFSPLKPSEQQVMFDAIPLITILVAEADGDMDEVELSEAQRLADIRSYDSHGRLLAFYELIEDNLVGRIQEMAKELPVEVGARQAAIAEKLAALNEILPKLALPFGYLYYQSFVSFAKFIAESHGGFMRFMTVSEKEAEVMTLPMVTPIQRPSEIDYPDLP